MRSIKALFTIVFLSVSLFAFSQSINEAGSEYNNGLKAMKESNYETAINDFLSCIDICDQLGQEGEDLKSKAQTQLASAYLQHGLELYKGKKFNDALQTLKKSSELAKQIGKTKTEQTAKSYMSRVYYTSGLVQLKKPDPDKALEYFNKSIEYDPAYYKAYYGKGLAYKIKDDPEKMKEAFDKVFQYAGGDIKTISKAEDAAYKYFLSEGTKALQKGNYSKASEFLQESINYKKPDASIYYYLAIAYNGLSKWDKAIEAANNGINLNSDETSNLYFELGKAYEGKGDKTNACEAYKNVVKGPNQAAAQHKVSQELKCE